MKLKELIIGITNLKSGFDFFINVIAAFLGAVLAYFNVLYLDNKDLFAAITIVVIGDWFSGVALALHKNKFETWKSLKVVYYLTAYSCTLAMVLSIEKGYPAAFWLSEAVIMPILVFQTISFLKNLSLLGLIPKSLLTDILSKIDKYKEEDKK